MKYALAITTIFLILGAVQIYYLLKKKLVKESILTAVLLLIALFYCYNDIFLWMLPGPSDFIDKAADPIAKLVLGKTMK